MRSVIILYFAASGFFIGCLAALMAAQENFNLTIGTESYGPIAIGSMAWSVFWIFGVVIAFLVAGED